MDIDFIRHICLELPAVTEEVKWGHDLVFSVGSKMFCVLSLEPPFTCSFRVKDEQFEEMSVKEGCIPAPYLARAKWVQVTDATKLRRDEWERYVQQSYELVAAKLTKKVRASLGI